MFSSNQQSTYKTRKTYTERLESFTSTTPGFVEKIKEQNEVLSTFTEEEIETINSNVLRDRQITSAASTTSSLDSSNPASSYYQSRTSGNQPSFRTHVTTVNKGFERDRR